jgi:hypothetical protein
MGTGSFPGVKRPGRNADHPPPSSAEVRKEYSYTSTQPLGLFRPVKGPLYLFMRAVSKIIKSIFVLKILDVLQVLCP